MIYSNINNSYNYFIKVFVILLLFTSFYACSPSQSKEYNKPVLVDKKASSGCIKLHKKLTTLSKKGFAIGHQDATSYGIGWKQDDSALIIKSDVNEVVSD